jgi:hypothetical protein
LSTLLLVILLSRPAAGYCRNTTCGQDRDTCQVAAHRLDPELCESSAEGCCVVVEWKQPCISFSLDTSNLRPAEVEEKLDIVTSAFETWTKVRCAETGDQPIIGLEHEFGAVLCGHAEYNAQQGNANIITFRDDWPYDPTELARTTTTWHDTTGELFDADIEVNTEWDFATSLEDVREDRPDLKSVLVHEAGHFLGIAHSDSAAAVMIRKYEDNANYRTLRGDDVEAVCAIYARSRGVTTCNYSPRNGFSAECAFDPGSGGWCTAAPARLPGRGAHLALFAGTLLAAAALRRHRRDR